MSQLSPGDLAPAIDLPAADGATVTLSQFQGQKVVVYFYPRDDTPGCTKEAIGFSEQAAAFAQAGAAVIGVSKDTVAKHLKFQDKHGLKVILLSDENGDVCERYGVWGEKQMYGKTFHGIERTTFLIDGEGRIAQVWNKVKVPGHVDAVLDAVRTL
ncbi:thioredoxin-dependent thiol peroxidase [Loktanella sp. SALINAS62]|uniref:thioredoxin-dependent thiol peroxidase n=1 Tax=Loktanella sp. SALINAS62 TaxID=2706124 RepID=UPI001B8AF351|nr:thioredoxin-dependent thiol peroxidase [Loktanella sp. SALINAS62]MBS1301616.1 thioredoxin-dependent thiol peroxidase [Loktanella sp. SALINAS62]